MHPQTNTNIMTNLSNLERNNLVELVNYTIDELNDLKGSTIYGCDLHNELFNSDYFIIGYYAAEQWLIKNTGVFKAIDIIQDYEKNNFGEVQTDLSSSEAVCNMVAYILGEELLQESSHLQNVLDNHLTDEDFEAIINDLKEFIA